MVRTKQLKGVSWASNLCQVRLFLSEDAPALSRSGIQQDHLQAKGSHLPEGIRTDPDESLPPGFEAGDYAGHRFKIDISQIPLMKWKCPPKFLVNPEWLVVAGEESEEVVSENRRIRGVLEAVYPLASVIPANPSVSFDSQESRQDDDSESVLIPITAVEEEDVSEHQDSIAAESRCSSVKLPPHDASNGFMAAVSDIARFRGDPSEPSTHAEASVINDSPPVTDPGVVAAASAAVFTAIMRSNEAGSLIDPQLLINILSNPAMIEQLALENPALQQHSMPSTMVLPPPPPLPPPPMRPGAPIPIPAPPDSSTPSAPNLRAAPPAMHYYMSTTNPVQSSSQFRDMNYYKGLVLDHGAGNCVSHHPDGYRGESPLIRNGGRGDVVNGLMMQGDVRPRTAKPCAYFNTPKGCRNGRSCSFQHDRAWPAPQVEQQRSAKRVRADRGGEPYRN